MARRQTKGIVEMPNSRMRLIIALLAISVFPFALHAQAAAPGSPAKKQNTSSVSRVPDFSGAWAIPGGASYDPDDPRGNTLEKLPMTPWALAKLRAARPGFGANATFEAVNDPVQKFCDPPGVTRMWMYPWNFSFIQTPDVVYILYEWMGFWRPVALNRKHPKSPDSTWMGDAIGWYEGDEFVVDTVGFNDKTWLDQVGHPHSDQLHLIERFRRVDHDTLEITLTFDDPKAYKQPFTSKRTFKFSTAPAEVTHCSVTEMQSFDDEVMKTTTQTPKK